MNLCPTIWSQNTYSYRKEFHMDPCYIKSFWHSQMVFEITLTESYWSILTPQNNWQYSTKVQSPGTDWVQQQAATWTPAYTPRTHLVVQWSEKVKDGRQTTAGCIQPCLHGQPHPPKTSKNNKKNITSKPSISPHMKSWTSWNNSFKKIHCNLKRNCVKPYPLTQSNLVVWLVPSGIGLWPFVDTLTSRPHQWTGRLCHYQARVHHPKLCSRVATKSTGQSPSSYIKSFGTCYWKINLTFNLKTGNPGSQSQQVFDPGNGADIVRIWKFD